MTMHEHKAQKEKSPSVARDFSQRQYGSEPSLQLVDNRPEATVQGKLLNIMDQSPQVQRLAQLQSSMNNCPRMKTKGILINDNVNLERETDVMGTKATAHQAAELIEPGPVDLLTIANVSRPMSSPVVQREVKFSKAMKQWYSTEDVDKYFNSKAGAELHESKILARKLRLANARPRLGKQDIIGNLGLKILSDGKIARSGSNNVVELRYYEDTQVPDSLLNDPTEESWLPMLEIKYVENMGGSFSSVDLLSEMLEKYSPEEAKRIRLITVTNIINDEHKRFLKTMAEQCELLEAAQIAAENQAGAEQVEANLDADNPYIGLDAEVLDDVIESVSSEGLTLLETETPLAKMVYALAKALQLTVVGSTNMGSSLTYRLTTSRLAPDAE